MAALSAVAPTARMGATGYDYWHVASRMAAAVARARATRVEAVDGVYDATEAASPRVQPTTTSAQAQEAPREQVQPEAVQAQAAPRQAIKPLPRPLATYDARGRLKLWETPPVGRTLDIAV